MSGLILNGDTSGSVTINVPAVAGTSTVTLPSTNGNIAVLPTGYSLGAGDTTRFKNRIINGDMRVDQRNNGSAVTVNTGSATFSVDRWTTSAGGGGVITAQRSTVAPAGFSNSLSLTVATVDSSIATNDYYIFEQQIEGLNCSDLGFGTANAKTVTLSFWVRSSLTGLASGRLANGALNRSYIFTYTIAAANTWEYKTVTIAGDTSGTWLTDTGRGVSVTFNLTSGSALTTSTVGSWVAGNIHGSTTQTLNFIGTSGATFYVTGVQLEVGSQATSFEYVDYTTQFALCQRYFQRKSAKGQPGPANQAISAMSLGLPVELRTDPSVVYYDQSGNISRITTQASGANQTMSSPPNAYGVDKSTMQFDFSTGANIGFWWAGTFWFSAEL